MIGWMTQSAIRSLDGGTLRGLAYDLGLAPRWVTLKDGSIKHVWQPQEDLAQAEEVFRGLRARGFSTSVVWWADYRQHGEVWASTIMRSVSVQWPIQVVSESHALLLCAVLAVRP